MILESTLLDSFVTKPASVPLFSLKKFVKDSSLVQSLIIFKACDSVSTVKYLRYFTLYSLTKLLKLSSTYYS